ncbi:MAG TPA: HAD hydrolase family protein [Dermatophilaceae bacterium]|jgi:hydroxymethylpyrimidine pyrophosphatase-like HAD family hydrolase
MTASRALRAGGNDLEMLVWTARGVAMGHAPADLREAADEVTGTIDDDGVVALRRSMLR